MSLINPQIFGDRELTNESKWFQRVFTVVSNAILALIGDQTWLAATLVNSWANVGGGNLAASYRIRDGVVMLGGLISGGVIASPGSVAFTLPAGYRPPVNVLFLGAAGGGGFVRIDVDTTGAVTVNRPGNSGTNTSVALDGIRFMTN